MKLAPAHAAAVHPRPLLALLCCLGLAAAGCGKPVPVGPIDLLKTPTHPGTAVAILVDTSGSMRDPVLGKNGAMEPKSKLARDALQRILQQTGDWKKTHADSTLDLGIFHFSASVFQDLAMGPFDQNKAEAALGRIAAPDGGTAIGLALQEGFKALYRSGCERKFLVCITDGENTVGPPPDAVARQLHQQTNGEVTIFFVAFDTSAVYFRFLNDVNGHAVEAANGAQLQQELTKIYEESILLEGGPGRRP